MLEMTGSRKRLRTGTEHEYSNKLGHEGYFIFGKPVDECRSLSCRSTDGAQARTRGILLPGHDRRAPRQPALNSQPVGGRGWREDNRLNYWRDRHRQGSHCASDSRTQPPSKLKSDQGELRGDASRPSRKRALRTRTWTLYVRHQFSCL